MGPVIICGMHRSGTSMITRALEAVGLFTGANKEHNSESVFFLTLNQWIFEQHGAGWDNTYNMRFANTALDKYIHTVTGNTLAAPSAASYTGVDDIPLLPTPEFRPWGWKDPRNTFTATTWRRHFPDARIIHVCRHPVDVAASLRRREQDVMAHHRQILANTPAEQLDGTLRFQQSARMFHLEEGIKLWQDYVGQALLLERSFGAHAIRIRYEDFLADPVQQLRQLAGYCGLHPETTQLEAATGGIDAGRRFAFSHDAELRAAWHAVRDNALVTTLGYDELDEAGRESAA